MCFKFWTRESEKTRKLKFESEMTQSRVRFTKLRKPNFKGFGKLRPLNLEISKYSFESDTIRG